MPIAVSMSRWHRRALPKTKTNTQTLNLVHVKKSAKHQFSFCIVAISDIIVNKIGAHIVAHAAAIAALFATLLPALPVVATFLGKE